MPNSKKKVFDKPTEIINFNFKEEGSHLALVDKAANLVDVLVMKAVEAEVQVTLSMKEYLKKFFNIWEEDAAVLAGILGYSSEMWNKNKDDEGNYLSSEEFIKQEIGQVVLLKSETDRDSLPKTLFDKVSVLMQKADLTKISKGSPLEDLTHSKGESMTDKVEQEQELVALRKAKADSDQALAKMQEEIVNLKKAKSDSELAAVVSLMKGYSFLPEDKAVELATFFHKAKDIEGIDKAFGALELAKTAVDSAVTKEVGKDTEEVNLEKSTGTSVEDHVTAILNARKSK